MASTFYPSIFTSILNGTVSFAAPNTLSCLLLTSAYTFNASHSAVSDVVSAEVTGTGYVRRSVAVTINEDITGAAAGEEGAYVSFNLNGTAFDLNSTARWNNATFTARYAAVFFDGANDGARKLVYLFDLGEDKTVTGTSFILKNPNPQPKIKRIQ